MTYTIRKATYNDIDALLAISTRVTNHNSRQFLKNELVDAFIQSEAFTKEVTDHIDTMQVLVSDRRIIGYCVWKQSTIHAIMVDCDYQGSGAASFFISEMCKDKFIDYPTLYLECFETNNRANTFYHKMGWTPYDKVMDQDLGVHRILYKKDKPNRS